MAIADKKVRHRFIAYDDPSVKVFDAAPGPASTIVDTLRDHVRQHGTPDLWRWHLHTKPPSDASMPVLVAKNIDVPENLRSDAGLAPCPLCCLTAPKYFAGILTWWPAERALRVVGIECARRLFKDEFDKELSRFDREQRASSDFDFLIIALPLVEKMLAAIVKLVPLAVSLDRLRGRVLKGLSKRAAKTLFKHQQAHGELTIFEERWVQLGGERMLAKTAVHRFPLHGAITLDEWRFSASALLDAAGRRIEGYRGSTTEEEILDALQLMGQVGMADARHAIIEGARNLREAHRLCGAIQAFLAPTNLDRLLEWSYDHRAELQLDIRKDQFGGTVFTHKPHKVVIPEMASELKVALPDMAFLDAIGRSIAGGRD